MKTIIKSILVFVIVFAATQNLYAAKDTLVVKASITCETCKKNIEDGLRFEKGIKLATVDVEAKTVTIIYSSEKTNPDALRKAISKLGYDADDVPADIKAYENLEKCCKKDGHH